MPQQPVTAYLTAVRLVPLADRIADRLDPMHVRIASQLRRAAGSVLSGLSEASASVATEQHRHLRAAFRSATECADLVETCLDLGVDDLDSLHSSRELIARIMPALAELARTPEQHH
jgi:four helix bundle protein